MKTYLVPEINKRFTEIISDYIQKGYIIHTNTMGGSQGELASVHLMSADKKTALRISLDSFYKWGKDFVDGYAINTRSYSTDKLRHKYDFNSSGDVLWKEDGEIIESVPFFQISSSYDKKNFYGDKEAYDKAKSVHMARFNKPYNITDRTHYQKEITSPKAIKAVLPWVKRQYKCTSAIPRDINAIYKCIDYREDNEGRLVAHPYYEISVRNSLIDLGARQHLSHKR